MFVDGSLRSRLRVTLDYIFFNSVRDSSNFGANFKSTRGQKAWSFDIQNKVFVLLRIGTVSHVILAQKLLLKLTQDDELEESG